MNILSSWTPTTSLTKGPTTTQNWRSKEHKNAVDLVFPEFYRFLEQIMQLIHRTGVQLDTISTSVQIF